jgi:CheY-like chemotaxis protein
MSAIGRVLVVDDSPTAVMHLSLLLRRMGLRVIPARHGAEALELLRAERPDAILLDLHMPVMDGLTFLSELRAQGELSTTPVIVVTVDGNPAVRERCYQLGCSGFLQKPVGLKELHQQVESCVHTAGARRGYLRAAYGRNVTVEALGQTGEYHAVTLSEGGIYLRMAEPLPNGTPAVVTLRLDDGKPLTLRGTVLYEKAVYGAEMQIDPGVAVVFSTLTPHESYHLTTLVRRHLMVNLFDEIGVPFLDTERK